MDLGIIRKKNSSDFNPYPVERRCLECGKTLENEGSHLYYQRFCSDTCKERYISSAYK